MDAKMLIDQMSDIVRNIIAESEERIRKDVSRVESEIKLLQEDVANVTLLMGRLSNEILPLFKA